MLSENEQALLQRLSCFAGAWTLEAAEHVCAGEGIEARGILDLLMSLADKSLVMPDEIDGLTRYTLLEPVRQYARERACEADGLSRWQARHFNFYFDIAERAKASVDTVDHAKLLGISTLSTTTCARHWPGQPHLAPMSRGACASARRSGGFGGCAATPEKEAGCCSRSWPSRRNRWNRRSGSKR